MANPITYQKKVRSGSDARRKYKVSQRVKGDWSCSCIGWTRHVPRKDCRHIKQVKTDLSKRRNKKFVGWDIDKYGKDFYAMPN